MSVIRGTFITMADRTFKRVEQIRIGDEILGFDGTNIILGRLLVGHQSPEYRRKLPTWLKIATERQINNRRMVDPPAFIINKELVISGDHLIRTARGWGCFETDRYKSGYGANLALERTLGRVKRERYFGINPNDIIPIGIAKHSSVGLLQPNHSFRPIESMVVSFPPHQQLFYAFMASGDHCMWANGYLVTAWADPNDYDYNKMVPIR